MCISPYLHQEQHIIFDESERKLVSALDEMQSLWETFVRRRAADTTVSVAICMGSAHCACLLLVYSVYMRVHASGLGVHD